MSSGIRSTRDVQYAHCEIGWGASWADGEAERPERPVWHYGFREDAGDTPDPSKFPTLAERLASLREAAEREWRLARESREAKRGVCPRRPLNAAMNVCGAGPMARRMLELAGEEVRQACMIPADVLAAFPLAACVDGEAIRLVHPNHPDPFACLIAGERSLRPARADDFASD